jgi:hypothetical protein
MPIFAPVELLKGINHLRGRMIATTRVFGHGSAFYINGAGLSTKFSDIVSA